MKILTRLWNHIKKYYYIIPFIILLIIGNLIKVSFAVMILIGLIFYYDVIYESESYKPGHSMEL